MGKDDRQRTAEKRGKHGLFKGTHGSVQRLAKQAHKELRLQRRAEWAAKNLP